MSFLVRQNLSFWHLRIFLNCQEVIVLITTALPKMGSSQYIGAISTHLDKLNSISRKAWEFQEIFLPIFGKQSGRANPHNRSMMAHLSGFLFLTLPICSKLPHGSRQPLEASLSRSFSLWKDDSKQSWVLLPSVAENSRLAGGCLSPAPRSLLAPLVFLFWITSHCPRLLCPGYSLPIVELFPAHFTLYPLFHGYFKHTITRQE